jgi:hypothetical protein
MVVCHLHGYPERFQSSLNFFTTLAIVCFAGGFLRSALKRKVYVNKLRTIQELETNIRREVAAISEDVLQVTLANMQRCV